MLQDSLPHFSLATGKKADAHIFKQVGFITKEKPKILLSCDIVKLADPYMFLVKTAID